MKTGVSIFLATFVVAPLLQLGGAQQTVVLQSTDNWPVQRTGEATLGLQIYRANGCAACHTEQVRQTGVTSIITLTGLGVYKADDFAAFTKSLFVLPELSPYTNAIAQSFVGWKGELPKPFLVSENQAIISEMADRLKAVGVKSETHIVATGADIARGWGVRQSVAVDYLYDQPVQLGSLRAGPDLANIGVRAPDANWQLAHLYAPKAVVPNSTMPSFKFLFEVRQVGATPSPDALNLPKEFSAAAGFEIVPKPEAKQLAAYLLSLKANVPLYEAPFTPVTAAK